MKTKTILFFSSMLILLSCSKEKIDYASYFHKNGGKMTTEEMVGYYTNSIEKENSDSGYYFRGRCNLVLGIDENKGEKFIQNALQDLNKTIELNQNYLNAFFWRAFINNNNSKYTEALKDFNTFLVLNEKESKKDTSYTTKALLGRGIILFEQKNNESALKDFNEVIKMYPDNSDAYRLAGQVKLAQKNIGEGLELVNKSIELNPNNISAYLTKEMFYNDEENFMEKKMELYDNAIKINPNSPDLLFRRANLKLALDSIDDKYNACEDLVNAEKNGHPNAKVYYEHFCVKPDLQIIQEKAEGEGKSFRNIFVVVRNNSSILQEYVQVNATWYDKDGKLVGKGMGNTQNLASGAKRSIEIFCPDIIGGVKYELEIGKEPF